MKHTSKGISSLPTKKQVERERRRYRRQKAYNKALGGTVYVLTIVSAVAVLIATLVLPVLQIEGTSMEPTLKNGDIVLLTKTTNFDRGELCGFSWNNKLLIKRVVGIPGDWIEIDTDGTVYLNGEKLDEPMPSSCPWANVIWSFRSRYRRNSTLYWEICGRVRLIRATH